MEDLIALLNAAEDHLARAKDSLEKAKVNDLIGLMQRFNTLLKSHEMQTGVLRSHKHALLESVMCVMAHFTKKTIVKLEDGRTAELEWVNQSCYRFDILIGKKHEILFNGRGIEDKSDHLNGLYHTEVYWPIVRHCFAEIKKHMASVAGDTRLEKEAGQLLTILNQLKANVENVA